MGNSSDEGARAVLLDIDGTLVDSTYHHALAWHRAFARHDVAVPMYRVHRAIGMGGDRLVGAVAGEETERQHGDSLRDAWAEEYAAVVDDVPPLPGAADLVRRLTGSGLAVGLASSGAEEFSRKAVDLLGIGNQVAAMTTADDADDSKPAPDILAATLDRLAPVAAAVLVGDTPYDVEAAGRLGLACVGVLTGGFSRAELDEAGAALVVDDLTGLTERALLPHLRPPRAHH